MEVEHVKGHNELVKTTPEVKHEDETTFTKGKKKEVSSPDSSMEVYSNEKGPHHNSSVTPEFDGNLSSSPEPESSPVMVSASPFAEENGMQKSLPEPSEMKSPPIQTMAGYDPNRIPASIFSTKTGNPGEWSTTSNESLFSIHMGNNSFSRDYAILFGKSGELPKLEDCNSPQPNPFAMSEELPRLEEWNNSQSNRRNVSKGKSNDFGSLPPLMEVPSQEESSLPSVEFTRIEKKDDNIISPKLVSGQTMENHGQQNIVSGEVVNLPTAKKPPVPETNLSTLSNPVSSSSPSRLSDVSGHSGSSFAFPVLASDSGKNDSMKVVPQKPEKPEKAAQPEARTQAQVSKETPTNVSESRWFSCFSCWPRFC